MRKRRSTVYVRPGKDVTLYIPTDTPPAVIEYLNRLKQEGYFSQGVMEILTKHVLNEPSQSDSNTEEDPFAAGEEWTSAGQAASLEPAARKQPAHAEPETDARLDLATIFHQAKRNSGKLMHAQGRGIESD